MSSGLSIKPLMALLAIATLLLSAPCGCAGPGQIIVLDGEEDTATPIHVVALNVERPATGIIEQDIQSRLDDIAAQGGLAIIAHPDRYGFTNEAELKGLQGYAGLELFPQASRAEWDAVLTQRDSEGAPLVWGFMTDDFHYESHLGQRFIMLRAPELTRESLFTGLKDGSFYWGNAPLIEDIALAGGTLLVSLAAPAEISVIILGGEVVQKTTGASTAYAIRGDEGYVRVEVKSADGKEAGTQPLLVKSAAEINNPYAAQGRWYKGNLHAHTTESDGCLSRQEVIGLYHESGYNFLAITDHVTWALPLDSEASIQGILSCADSSLQDRVAWVGIVEPGGVVFISATFITLTGPGVYEYTIPYVPRGAFNVVALVTASGYPELTGNDILAYATFPELLIVSDKVPLAGVDILISMIN